MNSLGYVLRGDVEEINLSPILMCTIFVAGLCFWLAFLHRRAWIRTGRQSDMMQLAMTAAIYDGIITLFAGMVLLSTPYMLGTVLEPLASVTDSILVWVLCCTAILSYVRSLRHGVAQLAGYPARAPDQLAVRHVVKRSVSKQADALWMSRSCGVDASWMRWPMWISIARSARSRRVRFATRSRLH